MYEKNERESSSYKTGKEGGVIRGGRYRRKQVIRRGKVQGEGRGTEGEMTR